MDKIRCAVIGVGYLGKFHAEKYQLLPNAELVAVCDINPTYCHEIAAKYGIQAVADYRELIGKVDAVSIVVPTDQHHQVAKPFLAAGIHVLLEKPITKTVEEAEDLINTAEQYQALLQIGHLERFNAARLALDNYLDSPKFIESHRLAPFNPRGTDVNVILDLMIHDIDLIQNMVGVPIDHIDAQGTPILSQYIDIANARITFTNGCIANVTASRISFKTERKSRIFQPNSYISVDFHKNTFAVFKKGKGEMFPGIPDIAREDVAFEKSDALLLEIEAFLTAIANKSTPLVTGTDGLNALATAARITDMSREHLSKLNAKQPS